MKGRTALLFPGQGGATVSPGMGRDLLAKSPIATEVFLEASNILGANMFDLCVFAGKEEIQTIANAQKAVITMSFAYLETMKHPEVIKNLDKEGLPSDPDFVTGNSVGQIAAMHAAGVFSKETAYRITDVRSRLMEEENRKHPGTMAALLAKRGEYLNISGIEYVCKKHGITISNYNERGQVVLSGINEAVKAVAEESIGKGYAKKLLPIGTSGALHSKHMQGAVEPFREALEQEEFSNPRIPIVGNTEAQVITTGEQAKNELAEGLARPVLNFQGVDRLYAAGVEKFIEVGPGQVLSNMTRNIIKEKLSDHKKEIIIVSTSISVVTVLGVILRKIFDSDKEEEQ